jgi:hypothetical protein
VKARLTFAVLVGPLIAALLPPAAPAAQDPPPPSLGGLTMVWDLPIYYPRQVPLADSGQTTSISVVVTSDEPVTINARSFDGGLQIADPQRTFGPLSEPTPVTFQVSALSPGFHSLSVQMDGSMGPPFYSVGVQYGFIWTSGSPLPEGVPSGKARSQVYGYQAPGGPPQLLNFVSEDYVHLGLPANGKPRCTQEGDGCVRYWVNPGPAQAVQIGTGFVGAFHRGGFYTDGFVPPGPTTGTPYGRYDFINPLYFVDARSGMRGTYAYADRSRTSGLVRQKVTFLKYAGNLVGDYRLSYAYAGGRKRTLEGKFRVEDGAITFRNARGRVVQRGTVLGTGRALPCAVQDTCRSGEGAGKRGIWLILSGRKGNHPDGNLLAPVKGK